MERLSAVHQKDNQATSHATLGATKNGDLYSVDLACFTKMTPKTGKARVGIFMKKMMDRSKRDTERGGITENVAGASQQFSPLEKIKINTDESNVLSLVDREYLWTVFFLTLLSSLDFQKERAFLLPLYFRFWSFHNSPNQK